MPSLTVENYLKAALQISLKSQRESVGTGELAENLGVSPGTVSSMLKSLSEPKTEDGQLRPPLVHYKPYEGISLTEEGRRIALRMLRRHRLLELFLVQTLSLSWDQVHEEAENMEHAVSDELIDRIDEFLGRPESDPHGDPIPTADGKMRSDTADAVPLSDCPAGTRIRIVRVTNQGPDFLRFLSESGLEIGTEGEVTDNNKEAGLVTTKLAQGPVSMAHTAADALMVLRVD
jgi:DtxR family transcriptional regulator, Mn-dependent transcriptional regulator